MCLIQTSETFRSRRCEGKVAYPSMRLATRLAEKVSLRTGELIISYECVDCGRFHIGHADVSQKLARGIGSLKRCLQCGRSVYEPPSKRPDRPASPILYCSRDCRHRAAQRRRTERANPNALI